jgi:hypothetical protein
MPAAAASSAAPPGAMAAPVAAEAVHIDLGRDGHVVLNGTPLAGPAELGQRLERVAGQPVTVAVGPGAPESAVSHLVAELRKAHASRVDLLFAPEHAESAPAPPAGPTASSSPPAPPPVAAPLPELTVRTVGMHIGGGPNDEQAKVFFRKRLEERFEEFRRCYSRVDDPGKGGTFGADIAIGREGGKPRIKQPRTAIGGAPFQDCMVGALSGINFPKPPRGPTVISYSVRFSIGGK